MRKIEPVTPDVNDTTVSKIRDFWTRNVNAEEILGRKVSLHERGEDAYFAELEQQRYHSHAHILPWIDQMEPGKAVLEIGCGIGMDSYQMAKRGLAVTGIDLTSVAIETAKRRFERCAIPARFHVGDATALEFPDEAFDYVYSFGVLHHTQDTEQAVREVYRVLRIEGTARIMLYNRHSINELVHRVTRIPFEDKNEVCPVVRRFTVREVKRMFAQFREVTVRREYVFGEGYGILYRLMPAPIYRLLSKSFGWHLTITAAKG